MAPSTFASAAAGMNQTSNATRDGASEWARRPNGATQTFRRPSGAATMASSNAHSDGPAPSSQPPPRYVPPHRNGTLSDMRYSKDQLLDLFRAQQSVDGGLRDGLPNLYVGGWQPDTANGVSSASWSRSEHSRDSQPGPDMCWERNGDMDPLGLVEMDDEERELFSNSVNTPIKPPATNKDNQQSNGLPGRKISVSGSANTPGGYGLTSPSATRSFGRRRETSESYPFPSESLDSPTTNREGGRAASPPPSLLRRRTDMKDGGRADDHDKHVDDKTASTPFGTLKRNSTNPLNAGFGTPSSPWTSGPQSAGLSPMGSFGNFGLGGQQGVGAVSDKRPGLGSGRAESRFKNLLSKDSNEDVGSPTVQRKGSVSSLSRVNENESWRPQADLNSILPETDEELPSGSAALAAGSDISPPQHRGLGTPSRSGTGDDYGLGAFGMTADKSHGFGQGFGNHAFQQTPAAQRFGQQMSGHEPMSPADTNPYRSPEQHGIDRLVEDENDGSDMHNAPLPGLGGFGQDQAQQLGGLGGLGSFGRPGGAQGAASDRSQTSSAAGSHGFPSLGGLGQLGGGMPGSGAWPATQPGFGTPSRQTAGLSNAFGGGIFATSTAEMQSPGLAGLGGPGLLSPSGGSGLGNSRMASMFPPAMQEQMRQGDQRLEERDISNEMLGQFGGLGSAHMDMQSPFAGQGIGEKPLDQQSSAFGALGQQPSQTGEMPMSQDQPSDQQPPSSASNQPPPPQQRTMVMPDRMRWIYRDPQGQTQGPWSGLEMHDWYKAGFFSPELLVKKFEDTDYEPLAQLIRRIGNSREPFLVPQIGIPHGPASNSGPTAWAGGPPGPTSSSGAQPPFASSFPSFGTTLTAEQQNALERRKQEEQYLMARQKEHLAQAQMAQRHLPMHPGGGPQQGGGLMPSAPGSQLHHHGSSQSLHSQPSFGSMTSPNAFQPSPQQGPAGGGGNAQGFFDNSFRAPQSGGLGAVGAGVGSLGHIREEEIPVIMDRLNPGSRAAPGQFGAPGQPLGQQQQQLLQQMSPEQQAQQIQQVEQARAMLQQEQAQHDQMQQQRSYEQPMQNERLQQFQQLQGQAQTSGLDARFQQAAPRATEQQIQSLPGQDQINMDVTLPSPQHRMSQQLESMSLTEQVEAAVSAQQSPVPQQPGLPQPFPPAPSQSPLPAPAAQRTGRQSVADQLQTESRDLSQTPSVETPSAAIAPWAKEQAEAPKGPSLKEIQEMEAKKAAETEALAAAARRAALQKEMEAQQVTAAAQPGLPASASWGATSGSPATPSSTAPAAWAKAATRTGTVPAKTMAQIQKEEEARKRKLAAAAAQANVTAMGGVAQPAGGKSYANLAGKVSSPPPNVNTAGGPWTTVGASGKPKTPITPATPATTRTVSQGIVPSAQPTAVRKAPSRSSTLNNTGVANAHDLFRRWAADELRADLAKGVTPEEFVNNLSVLGNDRDMITEAVHSMSNTIDSRHFAEEFLKRKREADKGTFSLPAKSASPANASNGGAGGWSEVAKTRPTKEVSREESNGAFKVVPSKGKKGAKPGR